MRTAISLLLLPLLLLCDRSAAGSFHHGSVGAESEPRDGVTSDIRLREKMPNKVSHSRRSAVNWTSNSSRADFPCPDAAAIAPCVCKVDNYNNIDLDCTFVESEEQLAAVFQQEFPFKELHEFSMAENSAIKVLRNILNGVTFETVLLYPGPFALEQISDYFLFSNKDTMTSCLVYESQLTSDSFPFIVLGQMEKLDYIQLRGSSFTWIPPILAPKISDMYLVYGLTDIIEAGSFPIHEWGTVLSLFNNQIVTVEPGSFFFSDENSAASSGALTIYLHNNQIQSLQAGTIPLRNADVYLRLDTNQIASIEPGTFVLPEATGAASSRALTIHLHSNQLQSLQAGTFPLRNASVVLLLYSNQISSIEPGTFVLPEATDSLEIELSLRNNQLTTVDEAVFGDLMPFFTQLLLSGNPLSCGCDIAWLVLNTQYLNVITDNAACADGTSLQDLDPQVYTEFC